MAKYPRDVEDWFVVAKRGFRLMCCSCSLVHEIDFRIRGGEIEMRMRRHEPATAAARRKLKKRVLVVDE